MHHLECEGIDVWDPASVPFLSAHQRPEKPASSRAGGGRKGEQRLVPKCRGRARDGSACVSVGVMRV